MDSLASTMGEHFAGFSLGVLLLAWCGSALLWRCRARAPDRQAAWCAGVLVPLPLVFFALAYAVTANGHVARLDAAISASLGQALDPAWRALLLQATRLADTRTLVVLAILGAGVLAARRHWWLAAGWVAAVGGNALLNTALKAVFRRARPEGMADYVAHGFSFPSGHASGAMALYGMLAYLLMRGVPERWRLPVLFAAIGVVWLVGVSRVALQVHYPSDVLAGYASGGMWLALCVAVLGRLVPDAGSRSRHQGPGPGG